MNPQEHEKKRLPRAVELEKRNYIGFSRQPVIDSKRVFASTEEPRSSYRVWPWHYRGPWTDA